MDLDSYIESVLFLEGEPVKIKKLAEILGKKEKEIEAGIEILGKKLEDRGIRLVRKGDEIMLSTAPEASKICEEISKEEFNKDIGKAGLEVLSVVIYRSPVSRADIDYIRGVNSSFTLRNLMVRGLLERKTNPKDSRSYLYSPSFQFLQFLGVENINKLPEYENFKKSIEQFMAQSERDAKTEMAE
jgi:segregation and condensation protein B